MESNMKEKENQPLTQEEKIKHVEKVNERISTWEKRNPLNQNPQPKQYTLEEYEEDEAKAKGNLIKTGISGPWSNNNVYKLCDHLFGYENVTELINRTGTTKSNSLKCAILLTLYSNSKTCTDIDHMKENFYTQVAAAYAGLGHPLLCQNLINSFNPNGTLKDTTQPSKLIDQIIC